MKFLQVIIIALAGIISGIMKAPLTITSPAFNDGGPIPVKYTCEGTNVSPPLEIRDIPKATKSLVIIMNDPDAPNGGFDHWVMWNIPPSTTLAENADIGIIGKNGKNQNAYFGPCPPNGTHHYHFKVFALKTMLQLSNDAGKAEVMKAMDGHILSSGELVGIFEKTNAASK